MTLACLFPAPIGFAGRSASVLAPVGSPICVCSLPPGLAFVLIAAELGEKEEMRGLLLDFELCLVSPFIRGFLSWTGCGLPLDVPWSFLAKARLSCGTFPFYAVT